MVFLMSNERSRWEKGGGLSIEQGKKKGNIDSPLSCCSQQVGQKSGVLFLNSGKR